MKLTLTLSAFLLCTVCHSYTTSTTYLRNKDLILRSTNTKKGSAEDLYQEIRVHLRSRVGALYHEVRGELMVIYKVPVKGGVYIYKLKKMDIDFEGTNEWFETYKIPHREKMVLKYEGETEATKKDVVYYDYMLIIHTKDKKPLLFSSKSSWKRLEPQLTELGAMKPFNSSAKKVTKLEKKLTPEEIKAARLKRNGVK